MEQRGTKVVIVLFWLSTMSWLVIEKVLPGFELGEPPSIRSIYASDRIGGPVGWNVSWNNEVIGWALSRVNRLPSGMTEAHSQVHLERIPLDEIVPAWMRPQVRRMLGRLDAESRLEIDPLNRLSGFRSVIRVPGISEPIVLEGVAEAGRLKMRVDAGSMTLSDAWSVPLDSLFRDELSPQMTLPGLRVGQTWTTPLCNPLSNSMEILQASVEGHELISWNGTAVDTLLVVYRGDSGSAFGTSGAARGRLWVDHYGTVLRQEASFLNSHIAFERMNAEQSEEVSRNADRWPPASVAPKSPAEYPGNAGEDGSSP